MINDMPTSRAATIAVIDKFCENNPSAGWHFGHIVLSDYNLDDASIVFSLEHCFTEDWIEESRAIHREPITDDTITKCSDFLRWLLTIPEDIRCEEE